MVIFFNKCKRIFERKMKKIYNLTSGVVRKVLMPFFKFRSSVNTKKVIVKGLKCIFFFLLNVSRCNKYLPLYFRFVDVVHSDMDSNKSSPYL
jgi:hypothetical protein